MRDGSLVEHWLLNQAVCYGPASTARPSSGVWEWERGACSAGWLDTLLGPEETDIKASSPLARWACCLLGPRYRAGEPSLQGVGSWLLFVV